MYPDFRYLLGALGIDAPQWMGLFKTFGLLVAMSFLAAAWVLTQELKRKEGLGWFKPDVRKVVVGKPTSGLDIFWSALTGFLVGYKVGGLIAAYSSVQADPMSYILSVKGNLAAGLGLAAVLGGMRWWEGRKQAAKWRKQSGGGPLQAQEALVKVWPHQRVGEMVILAFITGFIGAKVFNAFETWDDFIRAPLASLLSGSGLTFYGGLLTATAFFFLYARRRKWDVRLLFDCLAPGMMLAYGLGRLGCQMAGDGDWGIANSAYVTEVTTGELRRTGGVAGFQMAAARNRAFSDREYGAGKLQHAPVAAPSWLPRALFAMNYPHNVNEQGMPLAGCTGGEYCTVLPFGVFPTPVYESIVCIGLFGLLWRYRRRLTRVPLRMTGTYFVLNGVERFFIEKIRVNSEYDWGILHPSQAEIISVGLVALGVCMLLFARRWRPLPVPGEAVPPGHS